MYFLRPSLSPSSKLVTLLRRETGRAEQGTNHSSACAVGLSGLRPGAVVTQSEWVVGRWGTLGVCSMPRVGMHLPRVHVVSLYPSAIVLEPSAHQSLGVGEADQVTSWTGPGRALLISWALL